LTHVLVIQIILIAVIVFAAFVIVVPGRGARGQAIRTIVILLGVIAGIVAVIFPDLTTKVANLIGVGRGVDLILYGLIVFFIGFWITSNIHSRRRDRQLTILARRFAILETQLAEARRGARDADGGEPADRSASDRPASDRRADESRA